MAAKATFISSWAGDAELTNRYRSMAEAVIATGHNRVRAYLVKEQFKSGKHTRRDQTENTTAQAVYTAATASIPYHTESISPTSHMPANCAARRICTSVRPSAIRNVPRTAVTGCKAAAGAMRANSGAAWPHFFDNSR